MKKNILSTLGHKATCRTASILYIVAILTIGVTPAVLAQSGVPIIDGILQAIDDYKLALAMVGVGVAAVSLLVKPVMPSMWEKNREGLIYAAVGGIVLTMIPFIAGLIVGG